MGLSGLHINLFSYIYIINKEYIIYLAINFLKKVGVLFCFLGYIIIYCATQRTCVKYIVFKLKAIGLGGSRD